MKKLILCLSVFVSLSVWAQNNNDDQYRIRTILFEQTQAWNQHNLDKFMEGYWKHDSLVFIGSSGLTYGYDKVLNNYKRSYSSPDKMGQLKFTVKQMTPLGKEFYLVIGQWDIVRAEGNLSGHFSLTWKKINGKWKIIADHSS